MNVYVGFKRRNSCNNDHYNRNAQQQQRWPHQARPGQTAEQFNGTHEPQRVCDLCVWASSTSSCSSCVCMCHGHINTGSSTHTHTHITRTLTNVNTNDQRRLMPVPMCRMQWFRLNSKKTLNSTAADGDGGDENWWQN